MNPGAKSSVYKTVYPSTIMEKSYLIDSSLFIKNYEDYFTKSLETFNDNLPTVCG